MISEKNKKVNKLISESSPYLLQHAYNPVHWFPWNNETLLEAKSENKLLIISVGYAACHWCHVMEHESFEDESVAEVMNSNFISIKVDREERPDIDQIYMDTAYILTGRGGWPLNVIALPDGKPVFAGTYFRKNDWLKVLKYFSELYKKEPQTFFDEGEKLAKIIRNASVPASEVKDSIFKKEDVQNSVKQILQYIDFKNGGTVGAPKFPMPGIFEFLLKYNYHNPDDQVIKAVEVTLENIFKGGIYDHVGGGFARYSTDEVWKVPHFEKMLYDNAQLVSLYSNAYKVTKNPLYKKIVYETLEFVQRELTDSSGGFYSSLDADSEDVEGKYYIWDKSQVDELLQESSEVFCDYYNISSVGNWEGGNILFITKNREEIASEYKITIEQLDGIINDSSKILLQERENRSRPGLDDKILTSWNALMMKGFTDAYNTFGDEVFLSAAIRNANFISEKMMDVDGRLNRNFKNGKSTINAFLDDYAYLIEAFISLYEASFDEQWILKAKKLSDYVFTHFYDKSSEMFFFTSDIDEPLIARKIDFSDNVTPSSNSSLAAGLVKLSKYFFEAGYIKTADNIIRKMRELILKNPLYHSHWLITVCSRLYPYYEVAVVGNGFDELSKMFLQKYLPNISLSGGNSNASFKLLENKFVHGKTLIYVCEEGSCKQPVENFDEAVSQINK